MAPITFVDTYNMIAFITKSDHFWASVSIKKSNDVVRLQALIDRKKVIITEDTIRQALRLDDADGIDCLPNEEIFAELCMSVKRTDWNKFSSSMASAVICLATVMINAQVYDLSSHNTKYTSTALTQKVFTNMRRIGKGFSRMETPLFDDMLVQQQVHDVAEVEEDKDEDTKVSDAPTPPSPTPATTPPPPPQKLIPSPPQAQSAQPSSPPPTTTFTTC
nr:hypothetical protein [Tanacetum cinerariifolium]